MASQKEDKGSTFWWLSDTTNPDGTINPTITAISNIYCLTDFYGTTIEETEEKYFNVPVGYLKKILTKTENVWNDNSKPLSKKDLPVLPDDILEKATKLFRVTKETLQKTPFSPLFYCYSYGQDLSPAIKTANDENMKLILFIEKIATDCINYTINVVKFKQGDADHFGAEYELSSLDNKFRFKLMKNIGEITIIIGNIVGGTLSFTQSDLIYPIINRLERLLYESAVRDSKQQKVAQITSGCLNIMQNFLGIDSDNSEKNEEEVLIPLNESESDKCLNCTKNK